MEPDPDYVLAAMCSHPCHVSLSEEVDTMMTALQATPRRRSSSSSSSSSSSNVIQTTGCGETSGSKDQAPKWEIIETRHTATDGDWMKLGSHHSEKKMSLGNVRGWLSANLCAVR